MTFQKLLTKYYRLNLFPAREIDQILALSLHRTPEYIYKNPKKILAVSNVKTFKKLLAQRQKNYSLAYLKGYKEFYGFKFLVNKYTLIPRPASEILVQEALKFLTRQKNPKIIDIGTGSGCLIISIAKNFPSGQYYASDISSSALKIAKTNARKHKVKIKFIKSNLLNKIPSLKFNLIIANLPYLTKEQLKESTIKKEPRTALFGGKDGLEYYAKLLAGAQKLLAEKFMLLLEINPQQVPGIKNLIKKYLPQAKIEILKDLNQDDRAVKII